MQQPQHQQHLADHAHRFHALHPAALYALLLLSLLASLWHSGQHAPRSGMVESSSSAPGEERSAGEKLLEEASPAKLRRAACLRTPHAVQLYPALQGHSFAVATALQHSLAPAVSGQLHHTLPSLRQQRGQAPPLA